MIPFPLDLNLLVSRYKRPNRLRDRIKVFILKQHFLVHPDGTETWYREGKLHRDSAPAVVKLDGTRIWFRYGRFHREDGPAVEMPDGSRQWFIDDVIQTEITSKGVKLTYRKDSTVTEFPDGTTKWEEVDPLSGIELLHRDKAPAVVGPDGTEWYRYGRLHRIGGPAIECSDGRREWHVNGQLHRIGGPAEEIPGYKSAWYERGKLIAERYANGENYRDVNGEELGESIDYVNGKRRWINTRDGSVASIETLHEWTGPALVHWDGSKEWWRHGRRHRDDGPAIETPDGDEEWWSLGQIHREDGPAIVIPSRGYKAWVLRGKVIREEGNLLSPLRIPGIVEDSDCEDPEQS
ncbi:hypothetical protein [Microvirga massiliensis]|uniref:hypothetical protein n=1 Tax=Microvirga massiliensis TaxID=1033741 RepID=UPI00069ADD16|nr:hypothetical protein [Microvirga massiliensis]